MKQMFKRTKITIIAGAVFALGLGGITISYPHENGTQGLLITGCSSMQGDIEIVGVSKNGGHCRSNQLLTDLQIQHPKIS